MQVGIAEIMEHSNGFAFWIDPSCRFAQHVEEFTTLESLCCSSLSFQVETDPIHDGPVLKIGGPDDVKPFLISHFGIRGHSG